MDNQTSKPIGYECQKAILHGLPFQKRKRLSQVCPSIRAAQRVVPYRFQNVILRKKSNSLYTPCLVSWLKRPRVGREEFDRRIFIRYFKPGTVVRKLSIQRDRSLLPHHSGVRVHELDISYCPEDLNFEKINSLIDNKYPLERVSVEIGENSVESLNIPLFRNAECLEVSVLGGNLTDPITFYEKVMSCGNESVWINCKGFWMYQIAMDLIYQLAMKWKKTKQPIGTKLRLISWSYSFWAVLRLITLECQNNNFPIRDENHLFIPINEDSDIVMYEFPDPSTRDNKFHMEIVKKNYVVPISNDSD